MGPGHISGVSMVPGQSVVSMVPGQSVVSMVPGQSVVSMVLGQSMVLELYPGVREGEPEERHLHAEKDT